MSDTLVKVVGEYLEGKVSRTKPLVLSFHGGTGTGKTHVARILAHFLYGNSVVGDGDKSMYFDDQAFVHWRDATVNYMGVNDKNNVDYVRVMRDFVTQNTRVCQHSLFVFDEFDKMPTGLVYALRPYLDLHSDIEGVDYRGNIFILLSNYVGSGVYKGNSINPQERNENEEHKKEYSHSDGRSSFSAVGDVIDFIVPFHPISRHHVECCIRVELGRQYPLLGEAEVRAMVTQVANELQYDSEGYALSGCKMIAKKIDLIYS